MRSLRSERRADTMLARAGERPRSRFANAAIAATWLLLLAPIAHAMDVRALVEKGGAKFPPCATCHGARGEGMPSSGFPRLAGQDRNYLAKQLEDFRSGRRSNPIMDPIAKALDDATVTAIAGYYATLRSAPASPGGAAGDTRTGQELATRGDWDHDIPACTSCHGARLSGIPPHFPAIAGQNATYTAKQLRDWKTGARTNDPQALMKAVAGRLSEAQIDAVAAYLAADPPPQVRRSP